MDGVAAHPPELQAALREVFEEHAAAVRNLVLTQVLVALSVADLTVAARARLEIALMSAVPGWPPSLFPEDGS